MLSKHLSPFLFHLPPRTTFRRRLRQRPAFCYAFLQSHWTKGKPLIFVEWCHRAPCWTPPALGYYMHCLISLSSLHWPDHENTPRSFVSSVPDQFRLLAAENPKIIIYIYLYIQREHDQKTTYELFRQATLFRRHTNVYLKSAIIMSGTYNITDHSHIIHGHVKCAPE